MKGSPDFAARVVRWQRAHGRHDLPWQGTRDAYRVWLSEVMLQQTQVATVTPYYLRFLERFPTVQALASAGADEVLGRWSGLGYYALDANARRVLSRHAGVGGDPTRASVVARLWEIAQSRLPALGIETYTQGMMDLGAKVCTTRAPACQSCPVAADCVARIEQRVAELPGRRVRRPAPRKRVQMLVVVSQGEVLLEKRPPSGIWGGLWSLPEVEAGADPARTLERDWGLAASSAAALPAFEHAFTHFTLEVTPWLLRPGKAAALARECGASWLPLADLAGAALPAPVRKLLRSVAASSGTGGGCRAAT